MTGRFVSPNEMYDAAKRLQLGGRDPVSKADWVQVVNFFAANIAIEVRDAALPVVCMIFSCPLSRNEIDDISAFHDMVESGIPAVVAAELLGGRTQHQEAPDYDTRDQEG